MIMKKTLLSFSLCIFFLTSGCKDGDKGSCDLEGERVETLSIDNVRLFYNMAVNESYAEPCIFYVDGSAVLITGKELKVYDRICNFPSEVAGWDIPSEWIEVKLEGIRYKYMGVYPQDRLIYDLELTSLKRK